MRVVALIVLALLVGSGCQSNANGAPEEREQPDVSTSENPPDLVMVDEESLLHAIKSNGAHITVLNVWATWCGPCHIEMPAFVQYAKDAPDDVNVRFLSVDDENLDDRVLDFLTTYGVSGESYYSEVGDRIILDIHPRWQYGVPLTLIFNSEGLIADAWEGAVTYDFLEAKVERARGIIDGATE